MVPLAVLVPLRPLSGADVVYLDTMLATILCEWQKGERQSTRVIMEPDARP